jgi:hypothetical protein
MVLSVFVHAVNARAQTETATRLLMDFIFERDARCGLWFLRTGAKKSCRDEVNH